MRTDGPGELRRPAGAVLRPLALLVAAVASGLGMWHVLMQDGAAHSRSSRHVHHHRPAPQPTRP